MAKGFNWNRIGWQDRVRKQGDQHHTDTKKKTQMFVIKINGKTWHKKFDSKISALKAAQTIRKRQHKTTEVVEAR
tara:strand:- start:286 stop:510 length:225 start_codon:yes stop_codon:yes gene_type:complete